MSRNRRVPRQRSRQAALQTLYASDLQERGRTDELPNIEEVFDRVSQNFDLPAGARVFALQLACGTAAHLTEIDARVADNATNWKLSRMAAVDRNVLRLAVFELIWTDTPISVILDEAIQLAQRFGGDSSPSFVNGVLDAVAREIHDSENGRHGAAVSDPESFGL